MSNYIRGFTERGIGFDPATRAFFLLREDDEAAKAWLDARYQRIDNGNRWSSSRTLAERAVSFGKSLASGRNATPEVITRRKLSCFGDDHTPPCDALLTKGKNVYCGACRCGAQPLSNLEGKLAKLAWEYLECPKGRPGFSNEVRS